MARHHLCHLIGSRVLRWDDTVPAPTVNQEKAKSAIMSVVRVLAEGRVGWEAWKGAFEGDDQEEIERIVSERSTESIEEEVRAVWKARVGRPWHDGPDGESVVIELE